MFSRVFLTVLSAVALWQPQQAKSALEPDSDVVATVSEGLWPSPNLTNLLLLRWADEVGHHYLLEEGQQSKLSEAVVQRWTPFLMENRSKIQPLINEYIEMRLGLEPPSQQRVQAWAKKALPVLDQLRNEFRDAEDDVREMLNPAQRVKLEMDAAGFGLGMQVAENHLQQWQEGKFDSGRFEKIFWEPRAAQR